MYSMQGAWTTSTRPYTAQRSEFRPGASPAQHVPRHQDPAVFVELVTEEVEE